MEPPAEVQVIGDNLEIVDVSPAPGTETPSVVAEQVVVEQIDESQIMLESVETQQAVPVAAAQPVMQAGAAHAYSDPSPHAAQPVIPPSDRPRSPRRRRRSVSGAAIFMWIAGLASVAAIAVLGIILATRDPVVQQSETTVVRVVDERGAPVNNAQPFDPIMGRISSPKRNRRPSNLPDFDDVQPIVDEADSFLGNGPMPGGMTGGMSGGDDAMMGMGSAPDAVPEDAMMPADQPMDGDPNAEAMMAENTMNGTMPDDSDSPAPSQQELRAADAAYQKVVAAMRSVTKGETTGQATLPLAVAAQEAAVTEPLQQRADAMHNLVDVFAFYEKGLEMAFGKLETGASFQIPIIGRAIVTENDGNVFGIRYAGRTKRWESHDQIPLSILHALEPLSM
ncbi:MAG: hypothetical protein AAFP90_20660, partial [Planctomycetota bacterium]